MFNGENEVPLSSVKTMNKLNWLPTLGINHSTTLCKEGTLQTWINRKVAGPDAKLNGHNRWHKATIDWAVLANRMRFSPSYVDRTCLQPISLTGPKLAWG